MRSAIIIAIGFVLLGICLFVPRLLGRSMVIGAQVFIALWFLAAAVNMWMGVSRAGYSVMDELPIFLVIFALPAAAGAWVWWKFS
jgi:hypothetical protein